MNNRQARADTGTRKSCALETLVMLAICAAPIAALIAYIWP